MPGYIEKFLAHIVYLTPYRLVYAPYAWSNPVYGCHAQYGISNGNTLFVPYDALSRLQSITVSILYHMRAVDPSIHPALNEVSIPRKNHPKTH